MIQKKFEVKNKDLIVWRGQVVMSRSEEPFFTTMFKKLSKLRPASVLEVGFGMGVSAQLIQRYLKPEQHDIVEIEASLYRDLQAFASKTPGVRAVRGDFWRFRPAQKYDFIFFDLFDYSSKDDDGGNKRWAERMRKLLSPNGMVCVPAFGGERDNGRVPGFRRAFSYKARVPAYLLEDGGKSTVGIFEGWQVVAPD